MLDGSAFVYHRYLEVKVNNCWNLTQRAFNWDYREALSLGLCHWDNQFLLRTTRGSILCRRMNSMFDMAKGFTMCRDSY